MGRRIRRHPHGEPDPIAGRRRRGRHRRQGTSGPPHHRHPRAGRDGRGRGRRADPRHGRADRRQRGLALHQHDRASGLHRHGRRLYRHRHPRGPGQGLRDAAVVRQLRMEAARGLRGGGRHRNPGRGLRSGRRQRLCAAGRGRVFRPDRLHRHRGHQRGLARALLRHQLRPRDQLPRVHRHGLQLAGRRVARERDVRGRARMGPAGRWQADRIPVRP